MKYSLKNMALIGLTAGLTVVIGYVFYVMGKFLPIPGHKFLLFAPFLGFMLFIPACKIRKTGVLTAISLILALLMAPVSIFMSIGIVLSGICTDLITIVLLHDYGKEWKIMASVGLYPVMSILWAFIISKYFTGNSIYILIGGWMPVMFLCTIIYVLGIIGAYLSNKVIYCKIKQLIT